MAQYTVYPTAVSDTYLNPSAPTLNYASGTTFYLPCYTIDYIVLLRFNIAAAVPANKRIVSARLTLTNAAALVHLMIGVDSSDPATATYANRGAVVRTNDPIWYGGTAYADVTDAVKRIYAAGSGTISIEKSDKAETSEYTVGGVTIPALENGTPANRPVLQVVYEDAVPYAPKTPSPASELRSRTDVIRFSWAYNDDVGGAQAKFDLQWSSTGGASWTTVTQTTANQYYDMSAGTLPNGTITWRVRTYNANNDVSPYTDNLTFECSGAPDAPTVSSTTAARPVVSWTGATGQVAYQAQVLSGSTVLYDSGEVSGTAASHTVTAFLDDAAYTVKVRIKNKYGLWSSYGTLAKTITTSKPSAVACTVSSITNGLRVTPGSLAGLTSAVLYRKLASESAYIALAVITGVYDDYTVPSGDAATYFVRAINGGAFRDGATASGTCTLGADCIAPVSALSSIVALVTSETPYAGRAESRTMMGFAYRFDGRQYPVWEFNGQADAGVSGTYCISRSDAVSFAALVERMEPVCYRDRTGRRVFGVITSAPQSENNIGMTTVQLAIQAVDYDEQAVV